MPEPVESTMPSLEPLDVTRGVAERGLVSQSPFSRTSPIDGALLPDVEATAIADIPAVLSAAREAQANWAAVPLDERIRIVAQVKSRILDRAEEFARCVEREVGKPDVETLLGEVLPTADGVDYWCEHIEELLGSRELELDTRIYPHKNGVTTREPRGVVALLCPWNFPVALPLRTLVPALLAGNAVIFKPSEVSPRSGQLVFDLFERLLPKNVLQIVQGGSATGAALSAMDVDLVCFTGSVEAGKKVALACAERLALCALELGGKDAAIVLADANLDRAANGVVWGALMNAGQNCASIERVYVEASVAPAFTAKVAEIVLGLRMGVDVGPLTTKAQQATVDSHVSRARAEGARILAGGQVLERGYGYAPTVLTVTSDATPLMRDETFGPVVPIAVVQTVEEAIARINASRYGLTASVWTKNVRHGLAIGKKLRVGTITINNHAFTGALPGAPWSGYGDSGYGITSSPLALDALTRPRFTLVDRNRAKREMWWFPYTSTLRTIALSLAILRSETKGAVAKARALLALVSALLLRFRV
jgi:acyl-CoA reductase-like NAD-dependent aldehyde dehydrogenase